MVLFLVTSSVTFAQIQKHQIGISFAGGMQTLFYKPSIADHKQGLGGMITFDYQYFLQKQWSIGTGIGISSYSAKAIIDESIVETHYDDSNVEDFMFTTTYNDWTEKQNFLQLEIPIAVYFHHKLGNNWNFQCGFGPRIAFPLTNKYKVSGEYYETSGYYESTGVEYKNMPQHGFCMKDANIEGKSDVHIADIQFFTDLGFSYSINTIDLYLGAYCSYGLTNQINNSNTSLFTAEDYSGMLTSSEVNKLHNFAVGAKIGITKKIGSTSAKMNYKE